METLIRQQRKLQEALSGNAKGRAVPLPLRLPGAFFVVERG